MTDATNPQPKGFPVGLVGESRCQPAVRACRVGEVVRLLREPTNPFDPRAIIAICPRGQKLGYIGRDSFLHRAVHDDNKGVRAEILSVTGEGEMFRGIVLDVSFCTEKVGEHAYSK